MVLSPSPDEDNNDGSHVGGGFSPLYASEEVGVFYPTSTIRINGTHLPGVNRRKKYIRIN